MRILIIEDDLEAAGAMAHGLKEAGYEVLHAPDGEPACPKPRRAVSTCWSSTG